MTYVEYLIRSDICVSQRYVAVSASADSTLQDVSLQHAAAVFVSVRDKTALMGFVQVSKPSQRSPHT
jgi:hypothetical protein